VNLNPEPNQIHHIFIFSTVGIPLVNFLRQLGLDCTNPQINSVTEISSTLIFFENVFIEFFLVENINHPEVDDLSNELDFFYRSDWLRTEASPFGFGLSYKTKLNGGIKTNTLESILRLNFLLVSFINLNEPICYVVADYIANRNRLNRTLTINNNNTSQNLGIRRLTHVKLSLKSTRTVTTPLLNLTRQNILDIEYGKIPLLELTFDYNAQKKLLDLRPLVPIIFKY